MVKQISYNIGEHKNSFKPNVITILEVACSVSTPYNLDSSVCVQIHNFHKPVYHLTKSLTILFILPQQV